MEETEKYEKIDNGFTYDHDAGKVTGSAINKDHLYGGSYEETGKATDKEILAISFGRC